MARFMNPAHSEATKYNRGEQHGAAPDSGRELSVLAAHPYTPANQRGDGDPDFDNAEFLIVFYTLITPS